MDYLEKMTNAQLAQEYASYANDLALRELEKRDKLAMMTIDERMEFFLEEKEGADNQLLFEFETPKDDDNSSVKTNHHGQWVEAYEAGFKVGVKLGQKQFAKNVLDKMSDEFDREFVVDTFKSGS